MAIYISLSVYGGKFAPIINEKVKIPEQISVKDLLNMLQKENRMPQKFGKGEGFTEFLVLLNGYNVMISPGLETVLKDSDRVVVLPAMAGG
ncbi:MoaD/ThiS family protein [Sedimentibacter hydroxybenzoicus DSM 7310]|uniref:MoaD/ThiS family protein n=1 Tax=Sedimentibacter hydroxybenzoicus DSM 7310 TaxID=1123245 RepID=A0A974GVS0_SEDHY|nr:MoaD/ThiS family protein [Sedimentibacter hydroxybenzoicus]NYB73345.1 MoaD/ThiS family protein [Sedimentibacter hydroxybenzoicus DSM 7310]